MASDEKVPLEDELANYENRWVAILEDQEKIVGSGATAFEARADAEAHGFTEAALFKVRPFGKTYVYVLR